MHRWLAKSAHIFSLSFPPASLLQLAHGHDRLSWSFVAKEYRWIDSTELGLLGHMR